MQVPAMQVPARHSGSVPLASEDRDQDLCMCPFDLRPPPPAPAEYTWGGKQGVGKPWHPG